MKFHPMGDSTFASEDLHGLPDMYDGRPHDFWFVVEVRADEDEEGAFNASVSVVCPSMATERMMLDAIRAQGLISEDEQSYLNQFGIMFLVELQHFYGDCALLKELSAGDFDKALALSIEWCNIQTLDSIEDRLYQTINNIGSTGYGFLCGIRWPGYHVR